MIPKVAKKLSHKPISKAALGFMPQITSTAIPSEFKESDCLDKAIPIKQITDIIPARSTEGVKHVSAIKNSTEHAAKTVAVFLPRFSFLNTANKKLDKIET